MINPQAVIPMVIETTGRGERAFDIFSLLLKNRIVLVSTPITDQTSSLIVAQLIHLSNEDPEAPIQMYISSPGGVVYAGMGIYDTMKMIPNQISTVAVGFTHRYRRNENSCGLGIRPENAPERSRYSRQNRGRFLCGTQNQLAPGGQ